MARFTASLPSLAVLMVSMFCSFSSSRWAWVWFSVSYIFGRSSFSALRSKSSSSFFASSSLSSASRRSTSSSRKSRSFTALPTAASQKPFFSASSLASSSKRSISCWIMPFTFPKGSARIFSANDVSATLFRRAPAPCKASATRSVACGLLPRSAMAFACTGAACRNDRARAAMCGRTGAAFAPRCAKERSLTASISTTLFPPSTPSVRTVSASLIAFSSSALLSERWSQSFADVSQRAVRSFMYDWSSAKVSFVSTSAPRSSEIFTSKPSIAVCKVDSSPPFSSILPATDVFISLQASLDFSYSLSSSSFFFLNCSCMSFKVLRTSAEWNLYFGSLGSTVCWRNACTAPPALEKPRISASARPSRTSCTAACNNAGFDFSKVFTALPSDVSALVRSADSSSYWAASFSQRATVASSSFESSSCASLRSPSSLAFLPLMAVFSWMSAAKESILSCPSVIAVDFASVVSLQKQANSS
mmetsp:Transcript_121683/g.351287  ORF Transcript_121683/g.351287 Transcript_121683/m.351287 type:complete len:476 (-) Transcript_121683:213-1640(-)